MCKQRIQYTPPWSFDSVLLFVLSVTFLPAHVVLAGFIVPDLAVMSSEIRPGHSDFNQ